MYFKREALREGRTVGIVGTSSSEEGGVSPRNENFKSYSFLFLSNFCSKEAVTAVSKVKGHIGDDILCT